METGNITTSYGDYRLRFYVSENKDETNNASTVSWSAYLDEISDAAAFSLRPYYSSYSVSINGSVVGSSSTIEYDFRSSTSKLLGSGTTGSIGHNTDGSKSISVSASFSGGGSGYPIGNGSISTTFDLTDYSRPPTATAAPTFETRASGSSNIKMSSSGTATGRPAITSFRWRMYANGTGTATVVDSNSPYTWPNANTDIDYYVTAQAYNSEGFGPESTGSWAYAAPRIVSLSIPNQGTVGKPYLGTINGNNVSSYSAVNGSLPPGLSFSGGNLSGAPTLPGTYTFTIRATRDGVSYVDSAPQTIQVLAGGPWVFLPELPGFGGSIELGGITSVSIDNNVATITVFPAHGISELNQPITIVGLTGPAAVLNGNWAVQSWPSSNVLTFNTIGLANLPLTNTAGTGFFGSLYRRSAIKVYVNGQWVQAWMRYWDAPTQTWKNTA